MNQSFEFEEPWEATDLPDCLRDQLIAELSPGHPLYEQVLEVLATRVDSDDILVRTRTGYAMVHLSWCRRDRIQLPFPYSVQFNAWEQFFEEVYRPEVEGWKRDNPVTDWQELFS